MCVGGGTGELEIEPRVIQVRRVWGGGPWVKGKQTLTDASWRRHHSLSQLQLDVLGEGGGGSCGSVAFTPRRAKRSARGNREVGGVVVGRVGFAP